MSRPALFLDRDGVINEDEGYLHKIEEFRFVDGIFDLCATARRLGLAIVVVTNQAGIARGFYTEATFEKINAWMVAQFKAAGTPLDAVYFCPYHPEGQGRYRRASPFRKPEPGMLLQARDELDLDPARSVLVGDKESDIAAGRAAGVGATVLFHRDGEPPQTDADIVLSSHVEVADWLAAYVANNAHSVQNSSRRHD